MLRQNEPSDTDGESSLFPIPTTVVGEISLGEFSGMLEVFVGVSVLREDERKGGGVVSLDSASHGTRREMSWREIISKDKRKGDAWRSPRSS